MNMRAIAAPRERSAQHASPVLEDSIREKTGIFALEGGFLLLDLVFRPPPVRAGCNLRVEVTSSNRQGCASLLQDRVALFRCSAQIGIGTN